MPDDAIYLRCDRTERHYRVVALDKEANTITLKGKHGQWTEALRPVAEFAKIGYTRIIGPPDLEMTS